MSKEYRTNMPLIELMYKGGVSDLHTTYLLCKFSNLNFDITDDSTNRNTNLRTNKKIEINK